MREDTINRLSTKPAAVHARHSNATVPSSRASRSGSVWGLRRRRSRSGTRRCAACRGVVRDRRPTLLRAVRHRHGARPASRRRRCRCGSRGAAVARLVDPPRRRSRSVQFGQSEPLTDAQVVGIVGALVGPAAVVLVGSVVRGLVHGLPRVRSGHAPVSGRHPGRHRGGRDLDAGPQGAATWTRRASARGVTAADGGVPPLLGPERDHRVDAGRAYPRDYARCSADGDEHKRHSGERCGVPWRHLEEQVRGERRSKVCRT